MTQASFTVHVDDVRYTLHPSRLGPADALACREQIGMSLRKIMEQAQADPDIDVLAAIVWLARRQAGERNLKFAAACEKISYNSKIDVVDEDSDDAPSDAELADPELSGT